MDSENMKVAALGRPFALGMLYDARRDELIPGLTLWDYKTLQKNTDLFPQHSSEFEISTSDTIESKSSLLDVDSSLKASFLGGLIEVGGSAKYLNDTKKFKNQSRVTFQYNATTSFKQLSMSHLVTMVNQQKDVIKKGVATHVVTGILYGANAFFVFDSEKLDESSLQNVQCSMEAVIKKIPLFTSEGKVDIKLTDEEKALTNKISCKFHGDFILERNPATFEDAVKTYVEFPKLLGENGENSVPMKVWLMSLKSLDSSIVELEKQISTGLVRKVQDALEDLKQIRMRCNDSLHDEVVQKFPHLYKKLSRFQQLCDYYASNLQAAMAKKLLSVREGKEDEGSEVKLLFSGESDESPFSHEKLNQWLDHKEREINVIRSLMEILKGMKIAQSQSELDREVLSPSIDNVLCFALTSMEDADPYLDAMTNYWDTLKLDPTSDEQWYFSDIVLTKMRKKARVFHHLAAAQKKDSRSSFLIATIANKKYSGATIYHYKEGILVTENFCDLPPVEAITDRADVICYACDLILDPDTVNTRLTLSDGNKKVTFGEPQKYPEHPERFFFASQVLCKQSLTGRSYWEVEWSQDPSNFVAIGVAYRGIEKKEFGFESFFGFNNKSWCLTHCAQPDTEPKLDALHNNEDWEVPVPSACSTTVGVYLDWHAGTLTFYRVSSNTLSHIYTFHTTFTEPVYPGFRVSKCGNYVFLRAV